MTQKSNTHRSNNRRSRNMKDLKNGELRVFLLDQVRKFAIATGWARSTIGQYLVGNPRIEEKLARGGLQISTADKLLSRMQEALEYHKKHGVWPDAKP